jgi:3-deoxy-D-manno-octulosonic-acid transferase
MNLFWMLIYNVFLYPVFFIIIMFLIPFNLKLRAGFFGRHQSFKKFKKFKKSNIFSEIYWFHVSSFGEFQQIESIIDSIKKNNSDIGIVVSFFSPSGYDNVTNVNIDCKIYMPFDFLWSIFRVFKLIKPKKIIFASYDIWPNIFLISKMMGIDTMLISARIHKKSFKLTRLGKSIYRSIYSLIDSIFTVNNQDLLNMNQIVPRKKIEALGNPRFDIALKKEVNVDIKFDSNKKNNNNFIIFASLWPEDDKVLFPDIFDLLRNNPVRKIIILPHELSDKSINYYQKQSIKNNFESIVIEEYLDISKLKERVIIVNAIGILYKLYWQTSISYVGGGFSKNGIHNIMEPAVASNPVIFGPNFSNGNFLEAEALLKASSGFSVKDSRELIEIFNKLSQVNIYDAACKSSRKVMEENMGSTSKLLSRIVS